MFKSDCVQPDDRCRSDHAFDPGECKIKIERLKVFPVTWIDIYMGLGCEKESLHVPGGLEAKNEGVSC